MSEHRRFGFRSLRFKLVLASIVIEAVMLAALIWNSARITDNGMHEIFQNRVQTLVPLMNVSLHNPLFQRDYATLNERLTKIVRQDAVVYLEVRDERGRIVAKHGSVPGGGRHDIGFDEADGVYDQAFDITLAEQVIGHARYGLDVSILKTTLTKMHTQGAILALVEIVLTLLLLTMFGYLLTRRLGELARAAQAIQAGDYAIRIAAEGRDEVAVAAHAFNAMAQTVERDIDARERVTTALRDSEQRLRLNEANLAITLNSIGDAVIATDALGLIARMNPTAERLTGWTLDDASGQPLLDVFRIINAQTRLPVTNPVQLVMERGAVVGLANHTVLLARDGQEYQIADSAAPIRDATDAIVGVVLVFSDVTEKYQAEEALRTSEIFSRAILDSVSSEIAVLNSEGVILAVNVPWQRFANENGLAPGHPAPRTGIGSNYLAVCTADVDDNADNTALNAREGVQAVLSGQQPSFTLEYPCHSPDTQRWFSLSATPLGTAGQGVVVSHTNITVRKLAEEALRGAKDHLQTTLNAIPDLLLEVDASGRVLSYHAHRSDLLAAPPEVFLGKSFAEVLPPAATEVCMNALREAATKGWATGATYSLPLPQGETWFELSAAAMPIIAGETPGFILLARDVTERIQTQQALRASEQHFEAMAQAMSDIMYHMSADWSTMHPLDGRALVASTDTPLAGWAWLEQNIPADEHARIRQAIGVAIAQKALFSLEHRVLRPDGSIGWTASRAVPILDAHGNVREWFGSASDITTRKRAELALEASVLEKTALLNEVHHRVKNNLQVITSLLRLESFRSTDAPTKSVLLDMQGRVRAMALLHETLYRKGTFAAIDLGSYVGQIVGESLKSMQVNPGAVRLQLDVEALQVGLDQATPAGMLISELVSNCLKHAFPEGRTGEIGISLHPLDTPGHWRLRVSDSGIGFAADFEERRKTSLGLQLAGDMAKQMGGALHVGSGPQAVFTVDFKAQVSAPLVINFDGAKHP